MNDRGVPQNPADGSKAMDLGSWWIMDVAGPVILLIVLIWLVLKVRSSRDSAANQRSEEDTRRLYAKEEERRREGTDEL